MRDDGGWLSCYFSRLQNCIKFEWMFINVNHIRYGVLSIGDSLWFPKRESEWLTGVQAHLGLSTRSVSISGEVSQQLQCLYIGRLSNIRALG